MMGRRSSIVAITLVGLVGFTPPADARTRTTFEQTIQDQDRDNLLEPAEGEPYVVRNELGEPLPGREKRRRHKVFYGQLTDMHIVDEESPARVEFLDKVGPPFTSAYRPQEGLSPQVLESMVGQMRNTVSPVSSKQIEFVMTTGDNSDNTQLNETRWMIELLDGGRQINPDSGVPGSCDTSPDGPLYRGVRGGNEYYEPDESPGSEAGNDMVDGPGYSPNQEENEREAERTSEVRDWPTLFERMNEPFMTTGLGVPWYGIFGNHDALLQGNQPRNGAFERVATGCVKVDKLSPTAQAAIAALGEDGWSPEDADRVLQIALEEMASATSSTDGAIVVPSDERRRPLKKSEYIQEHFNSTGLPVGHGFGPENVTTGMGNYSFHPRRGLRFIVLDSISENGGDGGNIDETQFQWLHRELLDADTKKELVMVFAHHSLETMEQATGFPFLPGDQGGNMDPRVHLGFGPEGEDEQCAVTDPATPPAANESLHCLFLRHRGVIAFVNGHEHNNRIDPFERRTANGKLDGGFWEINTAAHIDWPEQSRVIDVFDNMDGNLSIFGTILDHEAAPQPGGAPAPSSGEGQSPDSVSRMASISRELSYNDPDSSNGEDGRGNARGSREDRNVELLVRNPWTPTP